MENTQQQQVENSESTESLEHSVISENSENSENSQSQDIDNLLAEAEARGYQRGRSEAIAESRQSEANGETDDESVDDSCPSFLAHIRPGFWD